MSDNNIYYLAQKKETFTKKKKDNKRKKTLFLPVIAIILFLLFAYFQIINNRILLYTTHYGEVIDGFQTTGILVRNEKVFYSNNSGYIELRKAEGERVAYGSEILKINDHLIYNRESGIISYAVDGLEDVLKANTLYNITTESFSNYQRKFKQNTNRDYLQKGQAAYRVIKNNELYVVIETSIREANRYQINEKVFINSPEIRKDLIQARVVNMHIGENSALLIISLDYFIEEWINIRQVDFELIKNIYRGIKIPRRATFMSPSGQGVLIYRNGNYLFREVKIVEGNSEEVIVTGLQVGEQIVINPEDLDYGRGL